jgi:hypothetical protein
VVSTKNLKGADWQEAMASMLGKEVRITLSMDDKDKDIVQGTLLRFSEDGEVTIVEEDGTVSWCWPNLNCELVHE